MNRYTPPQEILENYAKIMVNFALNGGKGIKKGETVSLNGSVVAEPLLREIQKQIILSGGHVIPRYHFEGMGAFFMENASMKQVKKYHADYHEGLMATIDHSISVLGSTDPHGMKDVNPKKRIASNKSMYPIKQMRNTKENAGKFSWTLCLYGTSEMAKESGQSVRDYWKQIIKACYLDDPDPIKRWKEIASKIKHTVDAMTKLTQKIDHIHMAGDDCDLKITLGKKRKWAGGSGRNIPSFEVFTSPDWRGTNGWIRFNQPLYRNGKMARGIYLKFKDGVVIESSADSGYDLLQSILDTPGGDRVGEYSLTDSRLSRIDQFMAETLYDENQGGKNGNTHIALGSAFQNLYTGKKTPKDDAGWNKKGFNTSATHVDIISTAPRKVTAYMKDGSKRVIYKDGQYCV